MLEDSRAVLIAADVPPDGPFPQDEKLKEGRTSIFSPGFLFRYSLNFLSHSDLLVQVGSLQGKLSEIP